MFDTPFDFFALVIAIVALIFARKAMNQVAELRPRLEAIGTTAAAATAVPPPLTPFEAFEQTLPPASPGVAPTAAAHRSRCGIRRSRCAVRDVRASRRRRRQRRRRRCRNPIAGSRKPSAPAGWCGSAG